MTIELDAAATTSPPGPRRRLAFIGSWAKHGPLVSASVCVLVLVAILALIGPAIVPYDPTKSDLMNTLHGASSAHWLGTDISGRDTLSRLVAGTRISIVVPTIVVILSTVFGVALGIWAGWRGGWVDNVLSRSFDLVLAFPGLLLAILAVAVFGKGLFAPAVAIAIAFTPATARIVRTLVRSEKNRPYVAAYAVQGFHPVGTAFRRVLPNIAPIIAAQASLNFGYALIDLAGLSFLGLGIQPPETDWGSMINDGRDAVLAGHPLSVIVPSAAVIVVVLAFTIVGQALANRLVNGGDR